MKKAYIAIIIGVSLIAAAGYYIPFGSYVPTKSVCPDGEPPVMRLHMIQGDSIQKVKDADVPLPPNAGCARQVKYVLYLF